MVREERKSPPKVSARSPSCIDLPLDALPDRRRDERAKKGLACHEDEEEASRAACVQGHGDRLDANDEVDDVLEAIGNVQVTGPADHEGALIVVRDAELAEAGVKQAFCLGHCG